MSSKGLLFEVAPLEGQGQAKKRQSRKQPAASSPAAPRQNAVLESPQVGFILSLDDVPCWQCGAPADLAEVLIIDGRKKWRVTCGWWCMVSWLIDPIPGLLNTSAEDKPFVVREGRHKGMTFDEIDAAGKRSYIENLVKLSTDKRAVAAAKAWLSKKIA